MVDIGLIVWTVRTVTSIGAAAGQSATRNIRRGGGYHTHEAMLGIV